MKFILCGIAAFPDNIDAVISWKNLERKHTVFAPKTGRTKILATIGKFPGISEEENHET